MSLGRRLRVLIVDHSTVMRRMVRRTLRQAGFHNLAVAEADCAEDAVNRFLDLWPDLVLSDATLPDSTGLELLERLLGIEPDLRFGFVTSEHSDAFRALAIQAGARVMLPKPFTSDDFHKQLYRYLRDAC